MNCATHRKTTGQMNSRRSACVSYVWPRVAQSARRLKNLELLNIAPSPDRSSQETGHGWLLVGGSPPFQLQPVPPAGPPPATNPTRTLNSRTNDTSWDSASCPPSLTPEVEPYVKSVQSRLPQSCYLLFLKESRRFQSKTNFPITTPQQNSSVLFKND